MFSTEKSLKEHGDKISDEEKKSIENGISDLRNALKGTDTEEIKKKTQNLVQSSMKLGEAVYKSQQKDQGPAEKPEDKEKKEKDKEDVVDADFEDVKDDKEKSA
jgi:molecular chaperone DnaK